MSVARKFRRSTKKPAQLLPDDLIKRVRAAAEAHHVVDPLEFFLCLKQYATKGGSLTPELATLLADIRDFERVNGTAS